MSERHTTAKLSVRQRNQHCKLLAAGPLNFSHKEFLTEVGKWISQERLKGTQVLWFLDMQEQGLLHSHGKAFKSEATEYSSLHVKKKKNHSS